MEDANARKESKKVEELSLKADELGKQLGPEWAALMDGIQDVDPGFRGRSGNRVDDTRARQGVCEVATRTLRTTRPVAIA